MNHQDAFGPHIEHIGVFAGVVASPVTGVAIALLGILINRRRHHLLAAMAVGVSDAVLGELVGSAHIGVTAACAVGAAASLFQAWVIWPFAQGAKRLKRRLRSQANV